MSSIARSAPVPTQEFTRSLRVAPNLSLQLFQTAELLLLAQTIDQLNSNHLPVKIT